MQAPLFTLAELAQHRADAESRMTSRVTVRRVTGETAQDEDTGAVVPVWMVTYTARPFRLGGAASGSQTRDIGGVTTTLAIRTGHLPASTDNLRDNDLIEVTAGENAGLVLRVLEATWQDQATARRVPVVETQRPTEWG